MLGLYDRWITGVERLERLKEAGYIRLDAKVFQTFWENKHCIPELWKEKVNGNTRYIFFDGTVLRAPNGHRYVLILYWSDGEWHWDVARLSSSWSAGYPSAVLVSSS